MSVKMDAPLEERRDEARVQKKPWRTPLLLVAETEITGVKTAWPTEGIPAGSGPLS